MGNENRRTSVLAASAALGTAAVLALTACTDGAGPTAVEVAAELSAEGQALAALGLDPDDLGPELARATAATDPAPSATPSPGGQGQNQPGDRPHKRRLARVMLRKNMLHGEAVVQTKDGPKSVVVQRGEVTEIDDTTVTVTSADGFTLTWTFGDPLRVLERRQTVQPEDVDVGTQIGVAGGEDGEATVARLIVVTRGG
jgi:hypothetical protein